jgi:polyketide cyclase/dehydrase/lipid transport protein
MGRARAAIDVPGPVSQAETLWYEPQRWPSWVDGFGHLAKLEGDWPAAGAHVVWDSRPGGRGRVLESVVRYEPRVGQVLEVEDERLYGTQSVAFAAVEGGTRVALDLDYRLKSGVALRAVVDLLFIRRAIGDSLRRTLARFGHELAADRELLR